MPCIINGEVIPDATWLAMMNGDVPSDVSFEFKVNMKILQFIIACNSVSPTLHSTAENAGQAAHRNADALVTEVSEHFHQVVEDTTQKNARVDDISTDYALNLKPMRHVTENFREAVTVVVDSREENRGELQHAIETQIDTQSILALQQSKIQELQAALAHLPELLQLNRGMQALRVENARLSLEKENYTSRTDMLLDVISEKNDTNELLHAQVNTLEVKCSELTSQVETVLAFAQSKQREVDKLREQSNEQGIENQGTHFSLNLFS